MTRANLGIGFKRYILKLSTGQPTAQQLSGFDRGYGVSLHYGAPWIQSIEVYANDAAVPVTIERFDLRDGWKLPFPGGFKKLIVNLKDDVVLNASRVVLDVYTVPGMIEVRDDPYQGFGARRIFESAAHADVGGPDLVVLAGGAGNVVQLAEVIADRYQGEEGVGYFPATGSAFYPSRFFGDDSNATYPTAGLYFDGWVSSSVAGGAFKLWITACRINFQGVATWVPYKELTYVAFTGALPVGIPTTAGQSIIQLWDNGAVRLPIPIPPDGFQIWAENLDGVAKNLKACIAGRTS